MKNLVVTLIVAIAVMASYSQAQAQYGIPSFDVPVVENTTREERKLKVRVNTSRSNNGSWVVISVYKLGTRLQTRLITVVEGNDFSMNIDNGTWGITVYRASADCVLSVWDD